MTAEPMESGMSDELPTALYRLFDAAGQLLYVGVTGDLKLRRSQRRALRATLSSRERLPP